MDALVKFSVLGLGLLALWVNYFSPSGIADLVSYIQCFACSVWPILMQVCNELTNLETFYFVACAWSLYHDECFCEAFEPGIEMLLNHTFKPSDITHLAWRCTCFSCVTLRNPPKELHSETCPNEPLRCNVLVKTVLVHYVYLMASDKKKVCMVFWPCHYVIP